MEPPLYLIEYRLLMTVWILMQHKRNKHHHRYPRSAFLALFFLSIVELNNSWQQLQWPVCACSVALHNKCFYQTLGVSSISLVAIASQPVRTGGQGRHAHVAAGNVCLSGIGEFCCNKTWLGTMWLSCWCCWLCYIKLDDVWWQNGKSLTQSEKGCECC